MGKNKKKNSKIFTGILIITISCLIAISSYGFEQLHQVFRPSRTSVSVFLKSLDKEAVLTGPTNDWIYYSVAGDETTKGGLWRIQKETKKNELVWEGSYCMFLVLGQEVFVQDRGTGIYRMEPDGSNLELIFEGTVNAHDLYFEDGWVYFSTHDSRPEEDTAASGRYLRYHTKTKEIEEVISDIRTSTGIFWGNFVVSGDYFYAVAWLEGKRGILSYNLKTGEQKLCVHLDTGIEAPSIEEGNALFLADGGEKELILVYLDFNKEGYTRKICAAKKGELISEKTVWREIRFPDMQEQMAIPPHPPQNSSAYAIMEASESGYVFHEGYAYYLNKDWTLCSRPLFGNPEEGIVYEGRALKVEEQMERIRDGACTLVFSGDCFYYRYYTEIDEEDAAKIENRTTSNYEPIPTKWEGYIGELPGIS